MNTVKKSFLISGLVAVLAVSGTSAFAWGNGSKNEANKEQRHSQMQQKGQRDSGKMMRGAVNVEYIASQLNLTAEQVTAVETVFSDFTEAQQVKMATQREAMRSVETRPTREEMQAMMTAHQAANTVQLTDQLNMVLPADVTEQLMEYVNAHSGMQHMRGK